VYKDVPLWKYISFILQNSDMPPNLLFVNNIGLVNSILPPPLSLYIYARSRVCVCVYVYMQVLFSGESLTNYVALLWTESGQPWAT
jgi:hypothetical protein